MLGQRCDKFVYEEQIGQKKNTYVSLILEKKNFLNSKLQYFYFLALATLCGFAM